MAKQVTKALAGVEDLLLGLGVEEQLRGSNQVLVTKVSGTSLPIAEVGGESIAEAIANAYFDPSSLQSDVATVQSDVATVQSDVATVQSDVATVQSDVVAHEVEVAASLYQVIIPDWDISWPYEVNSIVRHEGTLYTAILANTAQEPIDNSNWEIFTLGGDVGFLGIPYPKESTEYTTAGNFAKGTSTNHYSINGPRIPCATNNAYTINIGVSSTNLIEKSTKTGTLIWGHSYAQMPSSMLPDAYWSDPLTDDIYLLFSVGQNIISKIDFLTGAITQIFNQPVLTILQYAGKPYGGVHFEPRDPLNLTTCIWDAVGSYSGTHVHHIAIDTTLNTVTGVNISVDVAGTNQFVDTFTNYVTADKKIIIGGWTSGTTTQENKIVSFVVQRGETREYVEIPFDGNLPLVEGFIPDKTNFSLGSVPITTPAGMANPNLVTVIVMGSSVHFVVQKYIDTARGTIVGKRTFDRADFDRWLNAVCDSYNMPTGVAFY